MQRTHVCHVKHRPSLCKSLFGYIWLWLIVTLVTLKYFLTIASYDSTSVSRAPQATQAYYCMVA